MYPNVLGHPDNYIRADSLVTPKHIVPEWYFLPFYAILRAIPDKFSGVVAMFGSILILFLLPFLGRFKTKSSKFFVLVQFFF
jgi:quinol-cytochrome oxidoreductase complex cytochrome b subunit